MKNFFNKISISPSFLILLFFSLISGLFKDVLTFTMILFFHECGHIFFSLIFKWKIDKMQIGILGGSILYDEKIDLPFKQEFIICIAGVLFQIILLFIMFFLYKYNFITYKYFVMFKKYNYSIIFFNLLIIYPLDGSKLFFTLLNMFFSYKKSLNIIFTISILNIIIIVILFKMYNFSLEYSYIMMIFYLLYNVFKFREEIPYLFNKFLFERYFYPINIKKYNLIDNLDYSKMKRQKKNYFKIKNHYYPENKILSKRFD